MKGIKEVVAELGDMAEKAGHDAAGSITGSATEVLERVSRKLVFGCEPVAVEWYTPPGNLAELLDPQVPPVRIDADDAAVLLAAAMLAAGHTCRIVAQSFSEKTGFTNALVHVRVEGEWRRADALQSQKLDEVHPHAAELLGRILEPRR